MLDATCVLQVCPLLMAKYISKSRLYVTILCFVFIVFIGSFVLNTIHVKALYAIEAVLAFGACWLVVERCMIFRVLSCLLLGWFRLERILWHCCCHLERLLVIVKVYDNVSFTCLVFCAGTKHCLTCSGSYHISEWDLELHRIRRHNIV